MIERRTKVQLMVFVIITLLGVSYVGARYAQLDRLVHDDTYEVVAHFADSGGIFAGGEVTYRGVRIGQVAQLELTDEGVDVVLSIDEQFTSIPADAEAIVGNRSAVGEQYVELQPQSDSGPYLEDSSEIAQEQTVTPIKTQVFLTHLNDLVQSVNKKSLKTTVSEFGDAFSGTGDDLGQIIDTGNAFIEDANANFDVTTALIRDSNVVLQTQVDSEGSIRNFATKLASFSDTLAAADGDLRQVIDSGSETANELRRFLEDNRVQLGELINNLVTTGEVVVAHLDGVEQILVIYPYVVDGGFTVVSKSEGNYNAHFGLITTDQPPVCHRGYESTNERDPVTERGNAPMNVEAHCAEPAAQSNPRGSQHSPASRAGASYDSPVIATYNEDTHRLHWGSRVPGGDTTPGTLAPSSLGEESWKWLFLQPLATQPE